MTGKDELAIPYVDKVTNKPVAQSTVAEVLERIITEAEEARKLIREVDPLGPAYDTYTESGYKSEDFIQGGGFWLYRKSKLNYYGITAFLARVYLYKGDKV